MVAHRTSFVKILLVLLIFSSPTKGENVESVFLYCIQVYS